MVDSEEAFNLTDMDDSLVIIEPNYIYVCKLSDEDYSTQKVPPKSDSNEISLSRDASVQVDLKI